MIERCDSQYNTKFDRDRFVSLMAQRGTQGFEEKLAREKAYIEQQLISDIGERLGVAENTVIYGIRDGKLYEPGRDEPFEPSIRKGMYRRAVDFAREEAELMGFRTIQKVLADPDTPDGTTMLDITPRGMEGTNYEGNYFDTHTKVNGQVITTRYKSNLTNSEYRKKLIELNPYYANLLPEDPSDVDLKLNPLIIPSHLDYSDPDKLAKFILRERIGLSVERFEEIIGKISPLVTSYINTLVEHPESLYSLDSMQLAILRAAREENGTIGGGACGSCSNEGDIFTGESDDFGPLTFTCPTCGVENTRPKGQFIERCKNSRCPRPNSVLPEGLRKALPKVSPS